MVALRLMVESIAEVVALVRYSDSLTRWQWSDLPLERFGRIWGGSFVVEVVKG